MVNKRGDNMKGREVVKELRELIAMVEGFAELYEKKLGEKQQGIIEGIEDAIEIIERDEKPINS